MALTVFSLYSTSNANILVRFRPFGYGWLESAACSPPDLCMSSLGLKVVTPNKAERDYIHTVIFDELCAGKFKQSSRERFVQIIDRLAKEDGAQGVILGCTEIPLLIKQADEPVPVFDTTLIHSEATVERASKQGD